MDLPTKIEIYSNSIDFALLENKTGEITSSRYLTSIVDIVGNYSNIGNGALLITNGYVLVVIWGKNCFFLFDPHSKNSTGNICQNGNTVLLTFEMLNKLQEYIKEDKLKKKLKTKLNFSRRKYGRDNISFAEFVINVFMESLCGFIPVTKAIYDGKVHVCMTCHKSIMKKRTPCEVVSNTLDVEVTPKQVQNLKKLEKVLISKRILFKLSGIIYGKRKFPKLKGNICNIPVDTDTVCNVLARPVNNNELLLVKLKHQLRY